MEAFTPNRIYFLFPVHSKCLVPPSSTPVGDKDMPHVVFYWKFNFIQFLFEAFFNTINNFVSLQYPKKATF